MRCLALAALLISGSVAADTRIVADPNVLSPLQLLVRVQPGQVTE
jgi:hypothetical protein